MSGVGTSVRFDEHTTGGLATVRPLCRRYAVVAFGTTATSIKCGEFASREVLQWALGLLCNGELEMLGIWRCHGNHRTVTLAHLAELRDRGVEFLGVVVGADVDLPQSALEAVFPGTPRLESFESAIAAGLVSVAPRHRTAMLNVVRRTIDFPDMAPAEAELTKFQDSDVGKRYPEVVQQWREALARFEPIYSLHARLRGLVRSADLAAAEVRGRLARAVLRHGPFPDSGAALEFCAATLLRVEQRLDRQREVMLGGAGAGQRRPRAARSGARPAAVQMLA